MSVLKVVERHLAEGSSAAQFLDLFPVHVQCNRQICVTQRSQIMDD